MKSTPSLSRFHRVCGWLGAFLLLPIGCLGWLRESASGYHLKYMDHWIVFRPGFSAGYLFAAVCLGLFHFFRREPKQPVRGAVRSK